MIDKFRYEVQWHLDMNWTKWNHDRLCGWAKKIRRTDVLMSAMFRAAHGRRDKIIKLINNVGLPNRIIGNGIHGMMLYRLYQRPQYAMHKNYMMIIVENKMIKVAGTTHIVNVHGLGAHCLMD